jgi:hypothetical protein
MRNINDVEEAYKTLGLATGASIKEVREAHRDLCLVWDASRFDDNPQVQKKALDQQARIDEAFQTLRSHHGGVPKGEGEMTRLPPSEKDPVQPIEEVENSEQGAPSLYEEIFRGKTDKTTQRLPVGGIVAAIVVLVVIVGYLSLSDDEDELPRPPSDQAFEMEGSVDSTGAASGDHPLGAPPPDGEADLVEATGESGQEANQPASPLSERLVDTQPQGVNESHPLPQTSSAVDAVKLEVPVVEPEDPGPSTRPVLERGELNLVDEATEPTGQENQEDDGSRRAVEILKENSGIARKLIEGGGVADLGFQDWKTVRHNEPEFWIDVVAHRSTDMGELHLIWSVNTETGEVKPLSQAARDVESDPLDPEC